MSNDDKTPWYERVPTWHGYPLPAGERHPRFPWWCLVVERWPNATPSARAAYRLDGASVRILGDDKAALFAEIEDIEHENPLPAPPPRAGQVWRHATGAFLTIQSRDGQAPFVGLTRVGPDVVATIAPACAWPPPNAVLVYGPFAPWGTLELVEASEQ